MADGTLAYARELEVRDETIAASLEAVETLRVRVRAAGTDAERLANLLGGMPRERTAAAAAVERGEDDVEARQRELSDAKRAAATDRGGREASRLAVEQAERTLQRAEAELASAVRRATELADAQTAAEREAARLERKAVALAEELTAAPRLAARKPAPPGAGLEGILDWAARADAALLLARSGLAAERDSVVREANELAAAVLGELPVPAGVARIRERLDETIGP